MLLEGEGSNVSGAFGVRGGYAADGVLNTIDASPTFRFVALEEGFFGGTHVGVYFGDYGQADF